MVAFKVKWFKDEEKPPELYLNLTKVGAEAEKLINEPDYVVCYDAKRIIGKAFTDPEISSFLKVTDFTIVPNENGLAVFR